MLYRFEKETGEISYKLLCTNTGSIYTRHDGDFLLTHPEPDKLRTIGEKLRWYRLKHDLMQKECADIMQVNRKSYAGYEENSIEYVPLDKLSRLAAYYHIEMAEMLDHYHLFLLRKQGVQIKSLRKKLHMTQTEFAGYYHIPIGTLKNWETGRTRMPKLYYIRFSEELG